MKKRTCLFIMLNVILLLSACTGKADPAAKTTSELLPFQGKWEGNITIVASQVTFDMALDIYMKGNTQKVLTSSEKFQYRYMEVNWSVLDGQLCIEMNDEKNRAVIKLNLIDDKTLSGTYTQYGTTDEIAFTKTSDKAKNGKFSFIYPEYTYKERLQQLKDYSEYAEDGVSIPYTYALNQKDEYEDLIREYDLDSITKGHEDVDLMIVLLKWVSDNFKHDGSSGWPKKTNAISLIDYCKENNGVNCRGLSIILSELLRAYGIPAKHITCMPEEYRFDDCHVVVHAYSKKLNQWIMLDPTYKLVLQNEAGDYVSLPMLREMLVNDTTLIPNKDAGRNGKSFDLKDYRKYMTKNTFRFSCATDFYYGAEEGLDGNIENMLVPLNYTDDKKERTTTSDAVFWALP